MTLKVGGKDQATLMREANERYRRLMRGSRRAVRPSKSFGTLLKTAPEEVEPPVEMRTHPLGWSLSKNYGAFEISVSESDRVFWKNDLHGGKENARPDEIARFKEDVRLATGNNPVIASIVAQCGSLFG